MKRFKLLLVPVLVAAVAAAATATASAQASNSTRSGAVYTLSNSTAGNAVAVFDRAADGGLIPVGTVATGGIGTGGGLGSQGALAISADGKLLFAVNAGSNSITELAARPQGPVVVNTVSSGGVQPISITVHDGLVYVLNAGGAGNVTGFTVASDGLVPLAGSTRPLGANSSGPAQVSFTPDGAFLAVTEKNSSTIDTYAVVADGLAGAPVTSASAGQTPFGFDFDQAGHLLASEAASQSASSYTIDAAGAHVVGGPVSTNGQAAPCWLIATRDGKYAYTANAGSGTISGFSVTNGVLALLDPSGISANLGAGSHPLDEAVSSEGGFLYNLTDGKHVITGFQIGADGSLTQVTTVEVPAGAAGVVAS